MSFDRRELVIPDDNGMDVRRRALVILHLPGRHHQRVHELAEVIIRNVDTQVHEVVL